MRIYLFILILAAGIDAQAQTNKPIAITDTAFNDYFFRAKVPVVHGKIINATKAELSRLAISYELVVPFGEFPSKRIAQINNDGSFKLQLDYPLPYQQIWFSLGDYFYAGLLVNKDLNLELDFVKLKKQNVTSFGEGVKYEGTDGPLNEWTNKATTYKRQEQEDLSKKIEALNNNNADYLGQLDSLFLKRKVLNDEYIKLNPSSYSWILENERLSDYYTSVLWNATLTKHKAPVISPDIKSHKSYLISNSGMLFYSAFYIYYKNVVSSVDNNKYTITKEMREIDSLFGQPYADVLKLQINRKDVQENKVILGQLIDNIHTPWCKTVVEEEYKIAQEQLRQVDNILQNAKPIDSGSTFGKPVALLSFGAKLSTVDRISAKEFLGKLKGMYPGKAMVIDFWATWCAPCIADMPFSKKMHEETSTLPIEYVYICTSSGSSVKLWQNKIAELKQPGTHLFVDKDLVQDLMGLFKESGFPGYVCIDQSGTVIPKNISFMSAASINDIKKLVTKN